MPEDSSQEPTTDGIPPPPSGAASHRKHGRSSPYRMSSVIKLEYNTSHPIYAKIQDLILRCIIKWVLPSSGGGNLTLESSPSSSPLFPRRITFPLSGVKLMREMWFTNRDNVNLLLEICRVGFQTPLSEATILKKLTELYFHWEQVSILNLIHNRTLELTLRRVVYKRIIALQLHCVTLRHIVNPP